MLTLARTTIAIALLLALMLIGTIIGARAQQVTQNRPTSIALMDAECRWIFHPPQSSNSVAALLLNRCTGESYFLVGSERKPEDVDAPLRNRMNSRRGMAAPKAQDRAS